MLSYRQFVELERQRRNQNVSKTRGRSRIEEEWLREVESNLGRTLVRQRRFRRYSFDGYDPETHTCYELDGDYYHGRPSHYNPEHTNRAVGKKFGYLYYRTLLRYREILLAGYRVFACWEGDYRVWRRKSHQYRPQVPGKYLTLEEIEKELSHL